MRQIEVAERRARLARRHRLAPGHRAADVVNAARSMVCLHGTDPATVFLSAWARVEGLAHADVDRALYEERTLVKHLAMRRTIFVFPRELLGVAQGAASNRVALAERRRLIKDVEEAGLRKDGARWLSRVSKQVLEALADGEATSTELRERLPGLEGAIPYAVDKPYGGQVPVGPRVLTTLSAAGRILRATNAGRWTASRPRWAATEAWLGEPIEAWGEADGTRELVSRWLRAFGPGTEADLKWWLGSTLGAVRRALAELEAVEVELDSGTGYLLPEDLEPEEAVEPWGALLPALDPTTMGWFERDWYLGAYKAELFDTAGNAGPTMWWDGRIVGGWWQREDGELVLHPLERLPADATSALETEAARLAGWLRSVRVLPRFPSPLAKSASTR